jgi:hypothetical protein
MDADNLDPSELNRPSIEFLILADRAEAVNGKLYVMGGAWDRYAVQDFTQPVPISFAVAVQVPWGATNTQLTLRLQMEDADNRPVPNFTLSAGFIAGRPPLMKHGDKQRVILAMPLVPVKFPGPGPYQAVAQVVDDVGQVAAERRVSFQLVVMPQIVSSLPSP